MHRYRCFNLFLFVIISSTLAFELTCNYKRNTDWWAINDLYFCDLMENIEAKCDDVVTAINGQSYGKTNADVRGFRAENKRMHYFPQGLDKYFKVSKFEFIAIWKTGLKAIHQKDLAPFTSIRVLSIWENDVQVIERDLLKYNPHIEYIGLGQNKIKFVDGNVFGHLKNLHTFHIDGNQCISKQVSSDRRKVLDLIEEIKEKC